MKTALAITHIAFEDPAGLAETLQQEGFSIEYCDAVSTNLKAIDPLAPDLLVVLGGAIDVYEQAVSPFPD
jgi:GMP synthase (glutamine-hydrolysing)